MKARVKATGEIVEVEDLFDDGTAFVNGKCLKGYIKVSKLDFFSDFEDEGRWQKVRIQSAIAAMQAFCNDKTLSYEKTAIMAVSQADALVAELKKKGERGTVTAIPL